MKLAVSTQVIIILTFIMISLVIGGIVNAYFNDWEGLENVADVFVDAPRRVETDSIPLMVMIRDPSEDNPNIFIRDIQVGDMFEIVDDHPKLEYTFEGGNVTGDVYDTKEDYGHMYWVFFTYLDKTVFNKQGNQIRIQVTINTKSYPRIRELQITVTEPLPKIEHWYYGDTHTHSMYTNNYAEFGAPIIPMRAAANATGLSWFTITDHSCDMDETLVEGIFLPANWTLVYQEDAGNVNTRKRYLVNRDGGNYISALNRLKLIKTSTDFRDSGVTVLLGQEVNFVDVEHSNVGKSPLDLGGATQYMLHLLVYNNTYIEAPASGYKGILGVGSDHADDDQFMYNILSQIGGDGFAYAAHPQNKLDKWVSGDDIWSKYEYNLAFFTKGEERKVVGMEIWNTKPTQRNNNEWRPWSTDTWTAYAGDDAHPDSVKRGIKKWDELNTQTLDRSDPIKIFASAGSDAHGDFNYMGQFAPDEYVTDNYFGKVRTAIFVPPGKELNETQIYDALKNGHSVMTDGPMIVFGIDENKDKDIIDDVDTIIGESTVVSKDTDKEFYIQWESTPEFGKIDLIYLWRGTHPNDVSLEWIHKPNNYAGNKTVSLKGILPTAKEYCYYRLEAYTDKGYPPAYFRAYTNPIWVNISPEQKLHYDAGLLNAGDPVGTQWHELYPEYGTGYRVEDWKDNGDGELSPGDVTELRDEGTGEVDVYHVNEVTLTVLAEGKYIEYEGGYETMNETLINPVGAQWHEAYPNWCTSYNLSAWVDNGDDVLSFCDQIWLVNKLTGEEAEYHVKEVATDIIVEPTPPLPPPSPCPKLHYEEGLLPPGDPVCTQWLELWPDYDNYYHLSSWHDGQELGEPGHGDLTPCDQVDLTLKPDGSKRWYHVEEVTVTILVDGMYLELVDGFELIDPTLEDPVGTWWHEAHPDWCNHYRLAGWVDNGDDVLSFSDWIWLWSLKTGQMALYHVDEVATDIVCCPKPIHMDVSVFPGWYVMVTAVVTAAGLGYLIRRRLLKRA